MLDVLLAILNQVLAILNWVLYTFEYCKYFPERARPTLLFLDHGNRQRVDSGLADTPPFSMHFLGKEVQQINSFLTSTRFSSNPKWSAGNTKFSTWPGSATLSTDSNKISLVNTTLSTCNSTFSTGNTNWIIGNTKLGPVNTKLGTGNAGSTGNAKLSMYWTYKISYWQRLS